MPSTNIVDLEAGDGSKVSNPVDSTEITPWLDPQTEHSVARVFSSTTSGIPTYVYTNKVKAHYIDISKKRSTCSVTIQDDTLDQIVDYDGNYGIGLNSNVDGYDYLLVLAESSKANITTAGNYANDKIVLFSGYNRGSYSIDLDEKRVSGGYVGIEEMLNEIKVDGILEVNHENAPSSQNLNGDIGTHQVNYYDCKVIFNEKGVPDNFIGQLKYSYTINRDSTPPVVGLTSVGVFDKSGLQEAGFWNCEEILDYLMAVYLSHNPELRLFLDQADRLDYVSKFLGFDYGSLSRSDLADIEPKDFDITGMGLLDAIYKVLDQSRRYSVSKKYKQNGKAIIGLRANSKAQRIADNSSDIPYKLQIGEAGAAAVKLDIVESANLNLNRENKSVGRVVVRGGYLHINTLITTWGDNTVTPAASNSKTAYSAASNSENFTDHLNALAVDYTASKKGVPSQTYNIINTGMRGDLLNANLSVTLADFNETIDQEIFKTEKLVEIKPFLFKAYSEASSRPTEELAIYVAHPKEDSDLKESPILSVSGTNFIYIQPIEGGKDEQLKMRAKFKADGKAEFVITSSADKKDEDRTEHRFKEYIDNSTVPQPLKYPTSRGIDTPEIPLYIRCAVKTDYRLRGIAEIAGYDDDKHRTLYIDDREAVNIALQYKDKTYDGEGGWDNLTDGWIDGAGTAEKLVLSKLQSQAEAILDKYAGSPQNSGYVELNGCQHAMKPGDMIDEFEETAGTTGDRGFDFEAVVNKVGYDLVERKTIINFGAKFG